MKKFLTYLMMLILSFSLVACGSNAQSDSSHNEDSGKNESAADKDNEFTHPLLTSILGTWELQENTAKAPPYSNVTISENGTCIVDGKDAIWRPTDRTDESRIHLAFYIGDECIGGAQFSGNAFRATEPIGRPCEGVWTSK